MQEDARTYSNPQSFDLAILLFNSFGYYAKEDENIRVLETIFDNLAPDGWMVLEVVAREGLHGATLTWSERQADGTMVRRERHMGEHDSRVVHRLEIQGPTNSDTFHCSYRIYSSQELVRILLQVGFQDLKLSGDFQGQPYSASAEKLVVFAQKPPAGQSTIR